jgi:hypothetical protein
MIAMTLEEFRNSLTLPTPPAGLSPLLLALWYDGRNDWEQSHNIAQDIDSANGSWIHAYLHRKEGDTGNAAYWYRRAGKPVPDISLQKEWENISASLLAQ